MDHNYNFNIIRNEDTVKVRIILSELKIPKLDSLNEEE